MKFQPVKVGIIGCGVISDVYLRNLLDTFSITELVACADLDEEKSLQRAEQYQLRQLRPEELLADPEIELVANLTYASSHYEVNRQILRAGKHCYCEKMMADSVEQAKELLALAKAQQKLLACAPDTFLGGALQTARSLLDKGLIGQPVACNILLSRSYQLIKSDADDARRRFSVVRRGGGLPYDMGGYYLHALFNLFGPVRAVSGVCKTREPNRPYLNPRHSLFQENFFMDTENLLCGVLEFASGLCVSITLTSDAAVSEQSFTLIGTEGTMYLPDPNNFGDKVFLRFRGGEKTAFPLLFPYIEDGFGNRGIGIADMAWALRTGRPPRIPPEFGCHALEIVKGLVESAKTGQRVQTEFTFDRPAPLLPGELRNGTAERSLFMYADEKGVTIP